MTEQANQEQTKACIGYVVLLDKSLLLDLSEFARKLESLQVLTVCKCTTHDFLDFRP